MSERERKKRRKWLYLDVCSELTNSSILRFYYRTRRKGIELALKKKG
jgi:hypothetical protein